MAEVGLPQAARLIADSGLTVSSLCRGGFLTAADAAGRAAALADNRAAIVEAATLGTRELIMVVGGLLDGDKDLQAARERVADRIAELVPYAAEHDVRLVLEPLHPMYAADRAVLSTLGQALDLAAPYPPRRPSAWWSTRSTSGGTRSSPIRSPGPARGAARLVPGLRLQPAHRRGRPAVARE